MGTTIEDILHDEMINELHFEAVMRNEAQKQCIYIFVEGESEEAAFQPLLEDCGVDFINEGIILANYNGIGNLRHSLRLLKKTLSHDRPIIVTYDDDPVGKEVTKSINDPLITLFKIPYSPVVKYKDGSEGGSFEESFTPDCFIDSCFKEKSIDFNMLPKILDFKKIFNPTNPWVSQLNQFISNNGGKPGINKVAIAENMASIASPIPVTFTQLAKVVTDIRAKNPIKHPDDVDLNL
ncbi:TOPRIM nucleotidyl transferase/hydrolase domain-containing protein [Klebsiella michiganensis]|uniref:TOPRIM nucleotidyl transferase/hydrolase domain-containing protein n=1 Tax=Klebsiella michiganensis TaxID=1134687 RepID=UPI00388A74E4